MATGGFPRNEVARGDTRTFLWIVSEFPRLSKTTAAVFLDRNNERYLSTASAFFVPRVREASGITSLKIDEESALHEGRVPSLHSEPFDRMLVAQAIVHGMTILTPDPEIEQYTVRVLW